MKAILLDSPELDAYGQMALDEALLNSISSPTLILRLYVWPQLAQRAVWGNHLQAVSFGYFQSHADVAREVQRRAPHIPTLVRRLTGGGIVFHDGDITFSLIFPWEHPMTPSWIYKELHRGIHLGLKAQGIASRLWSPPDCKTAPIAVCFAEPSPIDLVHEDGKKFLGGALRRRKGVGLYQGSMRTEGFEAPRERLEAAILEGLSLQWKAIFRRESVSPEIMRQTRDLKIEKYATEGWNQKRQRGFT